VETPRPVLAGGKHELIPAPLKKTVDIPEAKEYEKIKCYVYICFSEVESMILRQRMPMRFAGLLLCASALSLQPTAAGIQEPARTGNGLLSGIAGADPAIRVFKGIPYAAPPVGDLRWRPPQPAVHWDGVRRADRFSSACMQAPQVKGSFYQVEFYPVDEPTSEDCLFLNIWTAAKSAGEKRPVLVWIHGGALREGSGSLPSFDGEALAAKGVVLVTINYRMGVFGFFAHPELTRESGHGASGNYGMMDQVAALRWVQKNISAFGGNPDNVTVNGQSAGSRSISCLMASPLAKGLFHRAIGQSGGELGAMRKRPDAEAAGVAFAELQGAASIAQLRAKPAEVLLKAGGSSGVIVDGFFLPDDPYTVFSQGRQQDVPVLLGSTADEHAGQLEMLKPGDFRADAAKRYGALAGAYLQLYPAGSEEEAQLSQRATSRDLLAATMRRWARMHTATGKSKAYMYYFDRAAPGRDSARRGAFHSAELVYHFNNLRAVDRPWEAADRKLADQMSSYWVNFAAAGNPNGQGLPPWPAYDSHSDITLRLGVSIEPRTRPDGARLDFFDSLVAQQRAN
jgi:para-nitrobenzyl esterase